MNKVILIAGHHRGGLFSYPHWRDPGAVLKKDGKAIDNEHWLAERLTKQAYDILKKEGYDIELCPFSYNLKGKINYCNKRLGKKDYIISVHLNSNVGKPATGTEVFYNGKGKRPRSFHYSKKMCKILADTLGLRNRGHKKDSTTRHKRLGIIRDTNAIAFLFEMGFINNPKDYDNIQKFGVEALIQAIKFLPNNNK